MKSIFVTSGPIIMEKQSLSLRFLSCIVRYFLDFGKELCDLSVVHWVQLLWFHLFLIRVFIVSVTHVFIKKWGKPTSFLPVTEWLTSAIRFTCPSKHDYKICVILLIIYFHLPFTIFRKSVQTFLVAGSSVIVTKQKAYHNIVNHSNSVVIYFLSYTLPPAALQDYINSVRI